MAHTPKTLRSQFGQKYDVKKVRNTWARISPRSVIVLDEAGAVGLDDTAKLFELAKKKDCRVVLCGDTGQHASVTRGDALRILEQYSGYRFSELTTIRRQKPAAFREMVELAAAKQTDKAFAKLLELGAVTETLTDDGKLYRKAADAYLSATKQGKPPLPFCCPWTGVFVKPLIANRFITLSKF